MSELDEILIQPSQYRKDNVKHFFTMLITDVITNPKEATKIRRKIASL